MCFLVCTAGAEGFTTPSPECVSPGLINWMRQDFSKNILSIHAGGTVKELFHIRDLSVFQNLLSLIRMDIQAGVTDGRNVTRVQMRAGDDLLSEFLYTLSNGELLFSVDGKQYRISEKEMEDVSGAGQCARCLETAYRLLLTDEFPARPDLTKISENIGSGEFFRQIDGLEVANISVTETRTEDQRLTQLDLSGSFFCMGESWSINGTISSTDGNKPADNAELQIQKDADNRLNVVLTSKNTTEKQNRNRRGTVTGNCRITVTGKRNGYDVKYGVSRKIKNEWELDGSSLREKVTLTFSADWSDKTPELKYRHLNTGNMVWKNIISMETDAPGESPADLHDNVSIELKMDGENVIIATADVRLGKDDGSLAVPDGGESVTRGEAEAITASVVEKVSRKLYYMMDSRYRNKINQGL